MTAITVFTPTYNRAHTLRRVWDSLRAQTFTNFEWIVGDDGSSDGTEALVAGWAAEAPFPVRYFRQANQGKHVAVNAGARLAAGELFLVADSDDAFVPETLETFWREWRLLSPEARREIRGVVALCRLPSGQNYGTPFPRDRMVCTYQEMIFRYRAGGERYPILATAEARAHPSPEPPGMGFLPEGFFWASPPGGTRKYLHLNVPLRIYWPPSAGSDQLSSTFVPSRIAPGLALWHRHVLTEELGWFMAHPAAFLRSAAHYARFSLHASCGLAAQWRELRRLGPRLVWLAALPAGLLAHARDRRRLARVGGRA